MASARPQPLSAGDQPAWRLRRRRRSRKLAETGGICRGRRRTVRPPCARLAGDIPSPTARLPVALRRPGLQISGVRASRRNSAHVSTYSHLRRPELEGAPSALRGRARCSPSYCDQLTSGITSSFVPSSFLGLVPQWKNSEATGHISWFALGFKAGCAGVEPLEDELAPLRSPAARRC